jgi:hypothetical protein
MVARHAGLRDGVEYVEVEITPRLTGKAIHDRAVSRVGQQLIHIGAVVRVSSPVPIVLVLRVEDRILLRKNKVRTNPEPSSLVFIRVEGLQPGKLAAE